MISAARGAPPAGGAPVIVWGTYDLGKPRVRILLRGARAVGIPLLEIHVDVWRGVEDKSQLRGRGERMRYFLRWAAAYPVLLWRYLRAPRHKVVFIPYMGHLDVVLLRPFARLRGARIVWDALLTLHGTLVEDRGMVPARSLKGRILHAWDGLALRCADHVITGTRARAGQYIEEHGVDAGSITAIPLSAELEHFRPDPQRAGDDAAGHHRPRVLFYGQFSPLHGLETVLKAADSEAGRRWDWVFIGTGQEGWRLRQWLEARSPAHVTWLKWLPYEELPAMIGSSDLCLGNFGTSRKAQTGISNKVFQVLACGRPLLTADSPAVRELVSPDMAGIYLVKPGDPDALAAQLDTLSQDMQFLRGTFHHAHLLRRLQPAAIGEQLAAVIDRLRDQTPTESDAR